jgi:hypothetical protein
MDDNLVIKAGIFIGGGAMLIYLAAFFPRALEVLPFNRWFLVGPPASRLATILIATACIVYGLLVGGIIPSMHSGLVFVFCATLGVSAALYDLARLDP